MGYDRYQEILTSVNYFKEEVDNKVKQFKALKKEWSEKRYNIEKESDRAEIETSMRALGKDVNHLWSDEYNKLYKMIDHYSVTGMDIPNQEHIRKCEELRSILRIYHSKLDGEYKNFKNQVNRRWRWEANK